MKVVVTRHPALVDFLRELGLVEEDVEIIPHASPNDVQGKDVIGVLPLHLATLAKSVTEVQLDLPPDARGRELSLEELRKYYRGVRTYIVTEVKNQ
jgi:putative CRISPR-associated protein (TIGR02620 family)